MAPTTIQQSRPKRWDRIYLLRPDERMPPHNRAALRFISITELVERMLYFLQPLDLVRLMRTDRRFCTLIRTSKSLQRARFLEADMVVNNQEFHFKDLERLHARGWKSDFCLWSLRSRKVRGSRKILRPNPTAPIKDFHIRCCSKEHTTARDPPFKASAMVLALPVVLNNALLWAYTPPVIGRRQRNSEERRICWRNGHSCHIHPPNGRAYCNLFLCSRFVPGAVTLASSCWGMLLTQPAVERVLVGIIEQRDKIKTIVNPSGVRMEDVRVALLSLGVDLCAAAVDEFDNDEFEVVLGIGNAIVPSARQLRQVERDGKGAYRPAEGEWVTQYRQRNLRSRLLSDEDDD